MISLIVSTKGRVAEIGALFESLLADASAPYEIILVDQNEDGRLDTLAAEYAPRLPLRPLRSPRAHANSLAERFWKSSVSSVLPPLPLSRKRRVSRHSSALPALRPPTL